MIQTNETTIQDINHHQENSIENNNENNNENENQVLNINIQHTMNFFDTLLQEITPPNSPFSNNFFPRTNNRLSPFHRVKYKKHKNIELLDNYKEEDDNENDNEKNNQHVVVDTPQNAVINNDKNVDKKQSIDDKKTSGLNEINRPHERYLTNVSNSPIKEYEDNQPVCIICLDIFDEKDTIFSNIKDLHTTKKCNCKYYVHKNCLNNWIYENEKCLMCKDPFQTIELIQDKLIFYEELEKKYMTKIHGNIEEIHENDYRNLVSDYHTLSGPFNLTNKKKTCCNNEECMDCMRHMLCLCIMIITVSFFFIILLPY